jgi:hypothetical protein
MVREMKAGSANGMAAQCERLNARSFDQDVRVRGGLTQSRHLLPEAPLQQCSFEVSNPLPLDQAPICEEVVSGRERLALDASPQTFKHGRNAALPLEGIRDDAWRKASHGGMLPRTNAELCAERRTT